MNPAISVNDLSHNYGDIDVLKNVSFSVNKGSFFIIIGPNGSGKTTLLKTISGIERIRSGKVDIFERSVKEYSYKSLARTMAFVPQTAPADFPFSVTELVLMGRSPHLGVLGLESREDIGIVKLAMEFTKISHLADRRLDQLSGGECQRVFIARAICQQPRIILLDEPTAALDLAHQTRIMDLMEELKDKEGITVVMVSHDLNLAAMYGDCLLLLKQGRIISRGTAAEVLTYQTLEKAYGCKLLVDKNPLGEYPRVTLVPRKFIE